MLKFSQKQLPHNVSYNNVSNGNIVFAYDSLPQDRMMFTTKCRTILSLNTEVLLFQLKRVCEKEGEKEKEREIERGGKEKKECIPITRETNNSTHRNDWPH